MGNCLFLRKGETHTEPFACDPVFANNTWEKIIEACQKNKVPDTWLVADQKTITIDGTDYLIDIIGKNHDSYSDGSGTAPLTFQMHDCYKTEYSMNSSASNSGGWESCKMRTTYLPNIFALIPDNVQAAIKEVDKPTSIGGGSSIIKLSKDKLFLLSEVEIFNTTSTTFLGEGKQYDYYAAGNTKIKMRSGLTVDWWERSPSTTSSYFCRVSKTGSQNRSNSSSTNAVSFAFCF